MIEKAFGGKMTNYDLLLTELRDHLSWMQDNLAVLENGERKILRQAKSGETDDTPSWMAEQKRRIGRLKDIIAAYERNGA